MSQALCPAAPTIRTSAPASSSIRVPVAEQLVAAYIRGVRPSKLLALTRAPLASMHRIPWFEPLRAACIRAVTPWSSAASAFAPSRSSSSTQSTCPSRIAARSGGSPLESARLMSAPSSTRRRSISLSPNDATQHRGDAPVVTELGSAPMRMSRSSSAWSPVDTAATTARSIGFSTNACSAPAMDTREALREFLAMSGATEARTRTVPA
jgi:hypothetical protein